MPTAGAVWAWAYPELGGVKRQPSAAISIEVDDGAPEWRKKAAAKAELAVNEKLRIRDDSPCEGVIILPAHNYDMNTWDLDGTPERTRRDWRRKINKGLDKMVDQALVEAEWVLSSEGVFFDEEEAA